jgi:hypothetical protein
MIPRKLLLILTTCIALTPLLRAQSELEPPRPLAPNQHAARYPLWEWLPVKGAEAYRITVHFPSYSPNWQNPPCARGVAQSAGVIKVIVRAADACTSDKCQAVLSYDPTYSPLTGSVQVGGMITPFWGGHDCHTGKGAAISYNIQALRGHPSDPNESTWNLLPWKDESAQSAAFPYWADSALPNQTNYSTWLTQKQHSTTAQTPHPQSPNEPFYVIRRYFCDAVDGSGPKGDCTLKAYGRSCSEATAKLLADASSKGDVCQMCDPRVIDHSKKFSGSAEWKQDGPCRGNP